MLGVARSVGFGVRSLVTKWLCSQVIFRNYSKVVLHLKKESLVFFLCSQVIFRNSSKVVLCLKIESFVFFCLFKRQ